MDNRRRVIRRKLMAFTPVYDLHPRMLLGYLGDLTMKGALVVGTSLTTIGRETELEINFPSDIPDIPTIPVKLPARIAWCRQDESPQYYNIGVEFMNLSAENAILFEQILDRYHFRYVLSDDDFDR
jgi:hypothetical protein